MTSIAVVATVLGRYDRLLYPRFRFISRERNGDFIVIPRIDLCLGGAPFRLRGLRAFRSPGAVSSCFSFSDLQKPGTSLFENRIVCPEDVFSHGHLYGTVSSVQVPEEVVVKCSLALLENLY